MKGTTSISARDRRILIAAAAKLTASSQPGEREVMFGRINGELDRLGITWEEIFDRALPPAADGSSAPSSTPDLMAAADAMMGGFADMMRSSGQTHAPRPRTRRHLSGDEIPPTVQGRISIVAEREWRGGTIMTVNVVNDDFVYGPMVVFQDASQVVARDAAERTASGRVDQPTNSSQSPVLHGLRLD